MDFSKLKEPENQGIFSKPEKYSEWCNFKIGFLEKFIKLNKEIQLLSYIPRENILYKDLISIGLQNTQL